MSKFNKKFVSLASSLLALTSIAGSAKATDVYVNPYQNGGNLGDHTYQNAAYATTKDYDEYMASKNSVEGNADFLKDTGTYVVNRVSNNRGKIITGTTSLGAFYLAHKAGVFDNFLGGKNNNKVYNDDFDNDVNDPYLDDE